MPAASGQADGLRGAGLPAVVAGQVGAGQVAALVLAQVRCGPGPAGGRTRVIALHFRKLLAQARELFIGALDLFVGVRKPFIGAPDRAIAGFRFFRSGVEFIGVSFSVQCHPKVRSTGRRPSVQSCPKNGRMMVEYWIARQ